jgi:hypothetical protein
MWTYKGLGILLSPDETLKDRMVVESFLCQASLAISRRMTEERLHTQEELLQGSSTSSRCRPRSST